MLMILPMFHWTSLNGLVTKETNRISSNIFIFKKSHSIDNIHPSKEIMFSKYIELKKKKSCWRSITTFHCKFRWCTHFKSKSTECTSTFIHQLSESSQAANLRSQLQLREELSSIVHIHRLLRWFSRSLRLFLWLRSNWLGNALDIPLDFGKDFI